ncbi:hypothetical protein [Streptomyces sp. NRRL F-5123]|uniref:hypothetical protein n=1 Tax=Streptomyces sp. NRRL F-5123 TaxID=1463856 RepID=UPI00069401AF|nr:hypothetical protein [Streptomyces sp. NRRL F-5123]
MSRTTSTDLDAETLALLDAIDVPLPDFCVDWDILFGTPLEMYEAGLLEHEKLAGLDDLAAADAIQARHDRLLAAADIASDDPTIAQRVREVLVDALIPFAPQLLPARTSTPAASETAAAA